MKATYGSAIIVSGGHVEDTLDPQPLACFPLLFIIIIIIIIASFLQFLITFLIASILLTVYQFLPSVRINVFMGRMTVVTKYCAFSVPGLIAAYWSLPLTFRPRSKPSSNCKCDTGNIPANFGSLTFFLLKVDAGWDQRRRDISTGTCFHIGLIPKYCGVLCSRTKTPKCALLGRNEVCV